MSISHLFKDDKFENMDWINKVVAPYEFSLATLFAQLPDRYELTYDDFVKYATRNESLNISLFMLINDIATKNNLIDGMTEDHVIEQIKYLSDTNRETKLFEFKVDKDCFIDFEAQKLLGTVALCKTKTSMEDSDIREAIAGNCSEILNAHWQIVDNAKISHVNEVVNFLDLDSVKKTRSTRKKVSAICEYMQDIMKENKWNIRNGDLAVNSARWLRDFIVTGNQASFASFVRLKCMTHFGNPIYSMEETK